MDFRGRPIGFVLLSLWSTLLGLGSIVLGIRGALVQVPLGILFILGAYGLWRQRVWGGVVLVVAWLFGAIDTAMHGNYLAFVGVAVVIAYLYMRRVSFEGSLSAV